MNDQYSKDKLLRDEAYARSVAREVNDLFFALEKKQEENTVVAKPSATTSPLDTIESIIPLLVFEQEDAEPDVEDENDCRDGDFILPLIDEFEEEDEPEESWQKPANGVEACSVLEKLPEEPAQMASPVSVRLRRFWKGTMFCGGDAPLEVLRKSIFWVSCVTLLISAMYILWVSALHPAIQQQDARRMAEAFHAGTGSTLSVENAPTGMLDNFRPLYQQNSDIAGWLEFHSTEDGFLSIDAPVMYSGDNETYTKLDATGKKSAGGSLFFDKRCQVTTAAQQDRVRVIYGQDKTAGGQLSGLHQLVGSVYYARAATTLSLTTLFEKQEYQVFAVVLTDEDAPQEQYFNTRAMHFVSDEAYLAYLQEVQLRSLFHYPVTVTEKDTLLVLSTTVPTSVSKLKNGRLTVYAKRVPAGLKTSINVSGIKKNFDAVMPYAWYTAQNSAPHAYYTEIIEAPVMAASTTSTTEPSATTTTTTTTSGTKAIATLSGETTRTAKPVTSVTGVGTTATTANVTTATTAVVTTTTTAEVPTTTTAPPAGGEE